MRRADHVLHLHERVRGADDRFSFVNVYRRVSRTAFLQRGDESALGDDGCSAGVDQERGRLHSREVGGSHDAARFLTAYEMQAHDVGVLEERLAALCDLETLGSRARRRSFATPAHHLHAERFSDARDSRADMSESVYAQGPPVQSRPGSRLPVALLETLHFERNMAQ